MERIKVCMQFEGTEDTIDKLKNIEIEKINNWRVDCI